MAETSNIFSKLPDRRYEETLLQVSPEIFGNIVTNRRSVRVFTEEAVPEAVVQQVLDWGLLAPTSSNLQSWEFYWVKDTTKKARLVEALLDQPAARTAQELIVAVAKLDDWKRIRSQMLSLLEQDPSTPKSLLAYYGKIVPLVYRQGPLGVFGLFRKLLTTVVGLWKPIPREPVSRGQLRTWAVKTTALACENIMLGFSAHGFDSCPMEGFDSKRVKKILGLGSESEIVMVISAGKRAPTGVYGKRIRMPRDQFVKVV